MTMDSEESDRQLLEQYPWAAYSSLPPVMRDGIEVMLLKEILLSQAGLDEPGIQTGFAVEFSQKALRQDKLFRSLFLTCWKLGSFDAVRESDCYQSFRETHTAKPLTETASASSANSHERNGDTGNEGSPQGSNLALTGQVVNIHGGVFTEVAGDSWTINYSVDQHKEIMDWYFNVDYQRTHQDVSKKRAENTGGWFTESEEYLSWHTSSETRVLWCPGIPGVGKTVLASTAINHLRKTSNPRDAVLFIYFNYTMQKEHNPTMILATLSRQMYQRCVDANSSEASLFEGLYSSHKTMKTHATHDELRDTLAESLRQLEKVTIVLDALDEYLEHFSDAKIQTVLDSLLSLNDNVKLLVTSRVLGEMENTFKDLQAVRREIHVHDTDVDNYLRGRVMAQEFSFSLTPSLTDLIVKEVKNAAKGRFLMAELHMNSLIEYSSPGDVKDALKVLPEEVDQTYAYVMDRINRHSERRKDLAMQTLMWIACAQRPLSLKELQHALATRQGKSNIDDYVTESSIITAACAGLVILQNEQNVISFVHYTTREFFDRQKDQYFPRRSHAMVKTCLNYLSRSCFYNVPNDAVYWGMVYRNSVIKNLQEGHAFYDYAALHWGFHAQEQDDELLEEILSFLRTKHNGIKLSLRYALYQGMVSWFDGPGEEGTGIFLAIFHKQMRALSTLMGELKPGSEQLVTLSRVTPLMLAVRRGPLEMVKLLAEARPLPSELKETPAGQGILYDINAVDKDGRTAIGWAVWTDYTSAVELLLQHPAVDVNISDNRGNTPLLLAVKYIESRVKMSDMLVNHKATDVNLRDNEGVTALSCAASGGFGEAVKSLLAREDVDVNLACNRGRSPLAWACLRGDTEVVKALLEREGIDVNLRDNEGSSPLSLARQFDHKEIVQLLLVRGAEGASMDRPGTADLFSYWVEKGGHIDVEKYSTLLDVTSKDNRGLSLLYRAVTQRGCSDPIVQQLLSRPDANNRAQLEVVALLMKHVRDEITTLESFLQHTSFDLNYANDDGLSAVTHAVIQKNIPALEFLLKREDVNPNRLDNRGRPPLYWAFDLYNNTPQAQASAASITKVFLMRRDFDPDITDDMGMSLVSYADKHLHHQALHLLLPRSKELESKKRGREQVDKNKDATGKADCKRQKGPLKSILGKPSETSIATDEES